MFYNNNDEEKRRRQMMGLEPNSWNTNTNQTTVPAKPMEDMTTREALETAWNNSLASNRQNSQDQSSESYYKLGTLSSKEESNNNYCAVGGDTNGGYSFGKYQIATKPGTMQDYIGYLNKNEQYKPFGNQLNNAGGSEAALRGNKNFLDAWGNLCKDDNFNQSQEDFIYKTHYLPVQNKLNNISGLNIENRNPVLKDVVYSSAVQHRMNTPNILRNAFQNTPDLNHMSDTDMINAIYRERGNTAKYFSRSTPAEQEAVKQRMERERQEALRLLMMNR